MYLYKLHCLLPALLCDHSDAKKLTFEHISIILIQQMHACERTDHIFIS